MGQRSTDIDTLIDAVIRREGGYSNHPADRGGPTTFGITQAVARANGFRGDMRDFPRSAAVAIYARLYWTGPGFDRVAERAPAVAAELFDTGVNMGVSTAGKFLQRALNALNRGGSDYPDLALDGAIGGQSVAALSAYLKVRGQIGEAVLVKAMEALQGERYIVLAEERPANEAFLYGWLQHRIGQDA